MMNSQINWTLNKYPPFYTPVYALIEQDICDLTEPPFVEKLVLEPTGYKPHEGPTVKWRLVDYDPEEQEEYLLQFYSVRGWRLAR